MAGLEVTGRDQTPQVPRHSTGLPGPSSAVLAKAAYSGSTRRVSGSRHLCGPRLLPAGAHSIHLN